MSTNHCSPHWFRNLLQQLRLQWVQSVCLALRPAELMSAAVLGPPPRRRSALAAASLSFINHHDRYLAESWLESPSSPGSPGRPVAHPIRCAANSGQFSVSREPSGESVMRRRRAERVILGFLFWADVTLCKDRSVHCRCSWSGNHSGVLWSLFLSMKHEWPRMTRHTQQLQSSVLAVYTFSHFTSSLSYTAVLDSLCQAAVEVKMECFINTFSWVNSQGGVSFRLLRAFFRQSCSRWNVDLPASQWPASLCCAWTQ